VVAHLIVALARRARLLVAVVHPVATAEHLPIAVVLLAKVVLLVVVVLPVVVAVRPDAAAQRGPRRAGAVSRRPVAAVSAVSRPLVRRYPVAVS
jgi:hypothetical protein